MEDAKTFEGFIREDCIKLDEIYLSKKTGLSRLLCLLRPKDKMRLELNIAKSKYNIALLNLDAPTKSQLKAQHTKTLRYAKKLYENLNSIKENYHFWEAIMTIKTDGIASHQINDETFSDIIEKEFGPNLGKLDKSLSWLIESVSPCCEEEFEYWAAKNPKQRKKPETELIQHLSDILTKYFEEGGYWRGSHDNPNSATGWRIDCLEFLLKRAGISKTRNQILEALA